LSCDAIAAGRLRIALDLIAQVRGIIAGSMRFDQS
jgi:hypothetical protein